MLIYVDDLILTGSSTHAIDSLVTQMSKAFAVKDLGRLNYFLGIEVQYNDKRLVLHQQKYAFDLLQKVGMEQCKPAPTLVIPSNSTTKQVAQETLFADPSHYCSLVGALQYIKLTHPDLQYAVNTVCQFL